MKNGELKNCDPRHECTGCYFLTREGINAMDGLVNRQRDVMRQLDEIRNIFQSVEHAVEEIPKKIHDLEMAIRFGATTLSGVFRLLAGVLLVFSIAVVLFVAVSGNLKLESDGTKHSLSSEQRH